MGRTSGSGSDSGSSDISDGPAGAEGPGRRVGGYFLWVRLPLWCAAPGSDPAAPFNVALAAAGLTVRAGAECTGNGVGKKDYIRLCFAR